MNKLDKSASSFVCSEIDKFLQGLEKKLQKQSISERAEVKKHARIAKLRDNVQEHSDKTGFWDEF